MPPTVVWRICDSKPGHANQTRGLVNALATLTEVKVCDIPAPPRRQGWLCWLKGDFPLGKRLPQPHFIVGAGHTTHVAVLAARRAFGGKAIVLMRPSLPRWLFDLCVVPQHDDPITSGNLILTRGVLNLVEHSHQHVTERGLMLIGGPSTAHGWNNDQVIEQVLTVATEQSAVHWTLTTSRRTPLEFVGRLAERRPTNLAIVPYGQTAKDWVPRELARSAQVWVSEDSVSMVYEALTSGAAVGVFEVPRKRAGRVVRGMHQLQQTGWVTRFTAWDRDRPLPTPPGKLHEARRCASLICERYELPRAA